MLLCLLLWRKLPLARYAGGSILILGYEVEDYFFTI
jgi:hypothetical protein